MNFLHPLTVHIHIAFFTLSFVTMMAWFIRGLATAVFENRLHSLAHFGVQVGVVSLIIAMAAGIYDGFYGHYATFGGHHAKWLYVKVALSSLCLVVYASFLYLSRKKRRYLQENPKLMVGCLATQVCGFVLVVVITGIGTLLVHHGGSHLLD